MSDSYTVYYPLEERPSDDQLEGIASFLESECEVLRPSAGDVETYVDVLRDRTGSLRLEYRDTVFGVAFGSDDPAAVVDPTFLLWIDERWILPLDGESDADAVARMDDVYSFLGVLYERFLAVDLRPTYVYGLNFAETEIASDPSHANHVSRERIAANEVPGIYWFQIFPPGMVEAIGEDRLRSAPAFRLEELSDGAVLLAATQGVLVSDLHDYVREAADHLGVPFE